MFSSAGSHRSRLQFRGNVQSTVGAGSHQSLSANQLLISVFPILVTLAQLFDKELGVGGVWRVSLCYNQMPSMLPISLLPSSSGWFPTPPSSAPTESITEVVEADKEHPSPSSKENYVSTRRMRMKVR